MRSYVCLFCGLPGAGKSTVARTLCEMMKDTNLSVVLVCYDAIMADVNHTANVDSINSYKAARSCIVKNIENLAAIAITNEKKIDPIYHKYLINAEIDILYGRVNEISNDKQMVFVVDDNMQYRGMRKEYYQVCCRLNIGFSVIFFDCPLEICMQRNALRKNKLQENVIEKIASQLEIPGASTKCTWEKYVLHVRKCDDTFTPAEICNDILVIMQKSANDPCICLPSMDGKNAEKTRAINCENLIHQSDICLRKYISNLMVEYSRRGLSSEVMKCKLKSLNDAKMNVYNNIKHGYVDVDGYIGDDNELDLCRLKENIDLLMCSELK